MTQHELAERAGVSVDLVRLLEQGRRRTARLASLSAIARALDVGVGALTDGPRPDSDARDEVRRVRDTSARLVALETMYGGNEVLGVATRAFRTAYAQLCRGEVPSTLTRDFESAVAEAAEVASWIAFDTERLEESRKLAHQALVLARSAGDSGMELLVMSHLSMLALHQLRPDDALGIAEEVLENRKVRPGLRALFLLRRGRALAQMGDRPRAMSALDAARDRILNESPADNPVWAWWLDRGELTWQRASMHTDLGDPHGSIANLTQAVYEIPPADNQGRDGLLRRVHLVNALVTARSWSQVERVLAEIADRIDSVRSGRAERLLGTALKAAASHPRASSEVRDRAVALRAMLEARRLE